MKNKILSRIPEGMYVKMFGTKDELQIFFDKKGVFRASLVGKKSKHIVDESRSESSMTKNESLLRHWEYEVPALKSYRDSLPEGHASIKVVDRNIYDAQLKIEDLREKVEKEDAYSFMADVVAFTQYEETIEAIDALADKIGAWFSTGALGKGTVTFNGKTYTAE